MFCSRHWNHRDFVNNGIKHRCQLSHGHAKGHTICDFLKNRFSGHSTFVLSTIALYERQVEKYITVVAVRFEFFIRE